MNKLSLIASCILLGSICVLLSCKPKNEDKPITQSGAVEDKEAKAKLQGIWVDDEGECVEFRAVGDSIYYPEQESQPLYFKIVDNRLIILGVDTISYHIDRLDNDAFWFRSITDEIIKLHRSQYALDSLEFNNVLHQPVALYDEVVKKDSVVVYDGHRYRGYVYINPSTMKVQKTSYNENGMKIERAFYDNVIHICVYEGKKSLYARDFVKKDFSSVVDTEFLNSAVLSDMNFIGAGKDGFWYEVSLCIPDEASCYQLYIQISYDGDYTLHKEKK